MDAYNETADNLGRPPSRKWPRRALWATGLLIVAVITALAFGAYGQPELLLNIMGLRYCG